MFFNLSFILSFIHDPLVPSTPLWSPATISPSPPNSPRLTRDTNACLTQSPTAYQAAIAQINRAAALTPPPRTTDEEEGDDEGEEDREAEEEEEEEGVLWLKTLGGPLGLLR